MKFPVQLGAFVSEIFIDVGEDERKSTLCALLVAEFFRDVLGRFELVAFVEFQSLLDFFQVLAFALR